MFRKLVAFCASALLLVACDGNRVVEISIK
jgi:hypothetical protein